MDPRAHVTSNGTQPARRPPEDEPERVGEGELDIGPPADLAGVDDKDQAKPDSLPSTRSEDVVSD